MEGKKSIAQKEVNLDYGICFHCQRIMPIKYLTQIRFHEGHLIKGKYHHKLICQACKIAANEVYNHLDLEE